MTNLKKIPARLILRVGFFVVIICLFIFHPWNKQQPNLINQVKNLPQLFINEKEISLSQQQNFVSTETLSPNFRIASEQKDEIKEVRLDGIGLLSDETFIKKKITGNGFIEFSPSFLISPGKHSVEILYKKNGVEKKDVYLFTLSFKIALKEEITNSEFLIIPDTTIKDYPKSWFVKDGMLKVNVLNGSGHASLAFLYPFGDIDLSFKFRPQGKVINLAFYFLERGRTLVIGNGNNKKITLLRRGESSVEGGSFPMETGKEYTVHVLRRGNLYEIFFETIGEKKEVLSFKDSADISTKADSVGFSVWAGSDGVEIKDLVIFPEQP